MSESNQAQHQNPTSRLGVYLNSYLMLRTVVFLTEEERTKLGEAYPRFRIQRRAGAGGAAAKASKPAPGNGSSEKNSIGSEAASGESKEDSSKQTEEPKLMAPGVADPDTLLARLNTRRLFRRIRYHQQTNNLKHPLYPRNQTTEEISVTEWNALLEDYKIALQRKKQARLQQQSDKTQDNQEQNNAQKQSRPVIPSPYEMLLFSPCPRAVTVLASYPRSGNSLLRNLFERTTLRVTGSDMRGGLTKHDLVGEAAVSSNMVQFVKTHFPERWGSPPFRASRAVLLVRNPYDAMESLFNLMVTNTHTTSVAEDTRQQHTKLWEEMARKEIHVWKAFHEYWLAQKIPILLIRYEDLIRYPDKVMAKVVRFVLEINKMGFFNGRIDRCILQEQKIERLGSYRPRSGGIGKSLSKYSPELLQDINVGILSMMKQLGYEEMLVPNPDEWKLTPMERYGKEFPAREPNASLILNRGKLVRGAGHFTNWRAVRKAMNLETADAQCNCPRCRFER